MKRIICFCLSFLLLLSLPIVVFADDAIVYELPEIGISVPIPSDFLVLPRTVDADDPVLALFGFTKTDWEQITVSSKLKDFLN